MKTDYLLSQGFLNCGYSLQKTHCSFLEQMDSPGVPILEESQLISLQSKFKQLLLEEVIYLDTKEF